ncbi:MAG: hypothetical protein ACM36B_13790 [Bacteroidota bacterium]
MNPNRIALALVLASLAAPAFAEKCHICDFSDEPIVVTPKKSVGLTPLDAPGGLAAAPSQPRTTAPSVSEVVVTKLSDATAPLLTSEQGRAPKLGAVPTSDSPKRQEVARWNLTNGWPTKTGTDRPRSHQPFTIYKQIDKTTPRAAPALRQAAPALPAPRR